MMPAVAGDSAASSAATSTSPLESDGISRTFMPHMVAVAGFVPCAASGTMISVRAMSPRAW